MLVCLHGVPLNEGRGSILIMLPLCQDKALPSRLKEIRFPSHCLQHHRSPPKSSRSVFSHCLSESQWSLSLHGHMVTRADNGKFKLAPHFQTLLRGNSMHVHPSVKQHGCPCAASSPLQAHNPGFDSASSHRAAAHYVCQVATCGHVEHPKHEGCVTRGLNGCVIRNEFQFGFR